MGTEHQYLLRRFLGASLLQLLIFYRIYDYDILSLSCSNSVNTGSCVPNISDVKIRKRRNMFGIDMIRNKVILTDCTVTEKQQNWILCTVSPRFLCRPTFSSRLAGAVGRKRALHKDNSGFASPTLDRHISTFRGYRILFSIRNPYINRFTNDFFYSFITISPSECGVTFHYSTILP